jgi:hypothetical protein
MTLDELKATLAPAKVAFGRGRPKSNKATYTDSDTWEESVAKANEAFEKNRD